VSSFQLLASSYKKGGAKAPPFLVADLRRKTQIKRIFAANLREKHESDRIPDSDPPPWILIRFIHSRPSA